MVVAKLVQQPERQLEAEEASGAQQVVLAALVEAQGEQVRRRVLSVQPALVEQ